MEDVTTIAEIYSHARTMMAATDNPNQWVDGHPRLSLIEDDIKAQISYVCVIDGRIEAVFVLLREGTPTMTGFIRASGKMTTPMWPSIGWPVLAGWPA